MGWNSWNHFAGALTDADVRAAADAIVSSGMKDAGYLYVNIDDTWQGERDINVMGAGGLHTCKRIEIWNLLFTRSEDLWWIRWKLWS
jgi:hypothetical protein